ncbi:hypothetical protein [Winogradskyella bathintestinalis]|uniref:Helix-turn-helix domain-containing protein n=1 Tax=Winogradskyella bathintestinalis TaxID=3035208 RepID=A0ABT7ZQJ8_9FLAO|nr:hypothetical protein [Winogradskyella bathintestinalis]MDN3491283.1 hypothetical protein [Winogradskyella bathintestinalis]
MEKLKFGYVNPEDCIEQNEAIHQEENHEDIFDEDTIIEIPLYDFEKTKEENLQTGVKYLLIPVRNDGFGGIENGQLLSEFSKIVLKQDDLFQCDSEGNNLIVVDYNSIFGLRLNRFINYNSKFFICDERVLFEFLLMKYEYFGFVPFFLSFPTIFEEMGIKKDRAVTIIKRFKELGFLESKVVSSLIENKQRQVTYYSLDTARIIELIPEIFLDEEIEWDIKHDIDKYLKSGLRRKKIPKDSNKRNQMQ